MRFFTRRSFAMFLLILGAVAVIFYIGWILFFSFDRCDSQGCFDSHLESCSRAKFIGGNKMIFEYSILGKKSGSCSVKVKLLQGDLSNQESLRLKGKEMVCSVPLGVVMIPGADLSSCHGYLKEEWQDLIIKKLHRYIVQNVGRINLDELDIPNKNYTI